MADPTDPVTYLLSQQAATVKSEEQSVLLTGELPCIGNSPTSSPLQDASNEEVNKPSQDHDSAIVDIDFSSESKVALETNDEVIEFVRSNIPRKTVVAFGLKNLKVFTGAELVDCVLKAVDSKKGKITREEAFKLAENLVNNRWLAVPVSLQQKKAELLPGLLEETKHSQGIKLKDCEQSLYRFTKDALVLQEISQETFEKISALMADPDEGIERTEGRVMLKRVAKDSGVFSKQALLSWMKDFLGEDNSDEVDSIVKLFVSRNVFKRQLFSFKFTPKFC